MPELDKAAKFNRKAREEHPSQPCLDIDVAALTQCVRVCPRVCRNPFFIHVFKTAFRFACQISKVIYQPHFDCEPSGRTCSKQISMVQRHDAVSQKNMGNQPVSASKHWAQGLFSMSR